MKELLIAEMKRAIEIMESGPEIKRYKMVKYSHSDREWATLDRQTTELFQILKMIRKHSIHLEKEIE